MAYCRVDDIQKYFLNVDFSKGGFINNEGVAHFIAQADAQIDGVIKNQYLLPIPEDGSTDHIILQSISEGLVVEKIDKIRNTTADSKSASKRNTGKEARAMLNDIRDGKIRLSAKKSKPNFSFKKPENISNNFSHEKINPDNWK